VTSERVRNDGSRESLTAADGAKAYANPKPGGCIAWGVHAKALKIWDWNSLGARMLMNMPVHDKKKRYSREIEAAIKAVPGLPLARGA